MTRPTFIQEAPCSYGKKFEKTIIRITARIARIVVQHYPHHLTRRGNSRQEALFNVSPLLRMVGGHWKDFLSRAELDEDRECVQE